MKFASLLLTLGGVAAELAQPLITMDADSGATAFLFETPATEAEKEALNTAFIKVMKQLSDDFDHDHHESFVAESHSHAASYKTSLAYSGYAPACGSVGTDSSLSGAARVGAFPGGATSQIGNFSLSKIVDGLAQKAGGAAAAQGGIGGVVGMVALSMTAAFVQETIAQAMHIIPPMIPPPVWNNQPLMCLPMVTGKNCFGAVFHTITVADFVVADVVDARLDGIIASFPETFNQKVGPAPNSVYQACFAAYMSMHCASIFPKCMAPQTGNDITTAAPQRVPMCFTYCLTTLLACPGFWIDDIIGQCQDISVPPACSTAFFWRMDLLPPQVASFEGSSASSASCPEDMEMEGAIAAATGGASAGAASVPTIGM